MALIDDLNGLQNALDQDHAFVTRLIADVQMAARLGVTTPTTNIATEKAAGAAAMLTLRKNIHDAARKIRADLEAAIDAL